MDRQNSQGNYEELEWCERKILLDWLELELVVGVM